MNPSNPQWYDAMQGQPLKKRMFTRDLAAKIRSESERPANRRWLSLGPAGMISAAAVVCVAGVLMFANGLEFFQRDSQLNASQVNTTSPSEGTLKEQAVQLAGENAGDYETGLQEPTVNIPEALPVEWTADPIAVPSLAVAEPTDDEWQQFLDETSPNFSTEILYKEKIRDDLTIVFSKKVNVAEGYIGVSLATSKFEWTGNGWKKTMGFGYSPHENLQEENNPDLLVSWYGVDLIPFDPTTTIRMFSGVVVNPTITQVRVIDDLDQAYTAQLLPSDDGFSYFFVALPPGERGSYTLEGADEGGQILFSDIYWYH